MNLQRVCSFDLLYFVCLTFVSSCTFATPEVNGLAMDSVQRIEVKNLPDTAQLFLSSFCSKVEYIPLELSKNSSIGEISGLSITEDGDCLVFDERGSASVYRFDSSGKFLNIIGRVGRQENEHSASVRALYDQFRNQVIIWDLEEGKIKYYSLDGKFLYSDDVDWRFGTFTVLDADRFLLYLNVSEHGKFYDFHFFIVSRDTYKVEEEILDPDVECQSRKSLSSPDFFFVNDTLFFKNSLVNAVYKISGNDIVPSYLVSYDKPLAKPTRRYANDYHRYAWKMIKSKADVSICDKLYISKNYCFVSSICSGKYNYSVIERGGLERIMSGLCVTNDMAGDKVVHGKLLPQLSGKPYYVSDSLCYYAWLPSSLSSNKQECFDYLTSNISDPEERDCAFKQWEEYFRMLDNDNPVLLRCTLK